MNRIITCVIIATCFMTFYNIYISIINHNYNNFRLLFKDLVNKIVIMTTECVKDFNNILSSFLVQVSGLIGTTYSYHLNKAIEYNALLPIEQFLVYAIPYREQILNRDETYFTEADHSNTVDNDSDMLNEFMNIKEIYQKLNKDSMDNVWSIFQALLLLGEDYIRSKQ